MALPTPTALGQVQPYKPPPPPKPGRATGEAFTANKSYYAKGFGTPGASKQASIIHPAIDLAGLGILSKVPLEHLRSEDPEARRTAKWELAGLGTLAAPAAYDIGKLLHRALIDRGVF